MCETYKTPNMVKHRTSNPKRREFFFVDPYEDVSFARRLKCRSKAKTRELPLAS